MPTTDVAEFFPHLDLLVVIALAEPAHDPEFTHGVSTGLRSWVRPLWLYLLENIHDPLSLWYYWPS